MERIVLEVDDKLAKKWGYTSAEKKKMLTGYIEQLLSSSLSGSEDDFWQFIDQISNKASGNGLTEAELLKMLNER